MINNYPLTYTKALGRSVFFALVAVISSGCVVHIGHHDDSYGPTTHVKQQLSLDGQGLERLVIESGAGDIEVTGDETITQIEVMGGIRTGDEHSEDYIFSLRRRGNEAVLVGKAKKHDGYFNRSVRVDMKVKLPSHLLVDVEDGSGGIKISKVDGKVSISDGSGAIVIEGLASDLLISDGSGMIEVVNVAGDVRIDDGSGKVIVRQVQGQVTIDDGSGVIEVSDVDDRVRIDDGSGDIWVSRVRALELVDDGSGEVHVEDVDSYEH